jgi:ankyrin repeat protein
VEAWFTYIKEGQIGSPPSTSRQAELNAWLLDYVGELYPNRLDDHPAEVKSWLDKGADPNAKDNTGTTALMVAARWGYVASVSLLLDRGAAVNARDRMDNTALILASSSGSFGDIETVVVLLKRGASPRAKTKQGKTALDYAREQHHTKIVRLLEQALARHSRRSGFHHLYIHHAARS